MNAEPLLKMLDTSYDHEEYLKTLDKNRKALIDNQKRNTEEFEALQKRFAALLKK